MATVLRDPWNQSATMPSKVEKLNSKSAADVAFPVVGRNRSDDTFSLDKDWMDNGDPKEVADSEDEWTTFGGDDEADYFSECESDFTSTAEKRRKFAEQVRSSSFRRKGGSSSKTSNIDIDASESSFEEVLFGERHETLERPSTEDFENSFQAVKKTDKPRTTLEVVIQKDRVARPRCSSVTGASTRRNSLGNEEGEVLFKASHVPPKSGQTKLGDLIKSEPSTRSRRSCQSVPDLSKVPKNIHMTNNTELVKQSHNSSNVDSKPLRGSLKESQAFYAKKDLYRQKRRGSFDASSTPSLGKSPDMDNSMKTPRSPIGSLETGTSSLSLGETLSKETNRRRRSSVGSGGSSSRGSRSSRGHSVTSAPASLSKKDKNSSGGERPRKSGRDRETEKGGQGKRYLRRSSLGSEPTRGHSTTDKKVRSRKMDGSKYERRSSRSLRSSGENRKVSGRPSSIDERRAPSRSRSREQSRQRGGRDTNEKSSSAESRSRRDASRSRSRIRDRSRSRSRCRKEECIRKPVDNSLQVLEDSEPRAVHPAKSSEYLPAGLYGIAQHGPSGNSDDYLTSESESENDAPKESRSRPDSRSVSRSRERRRSVSRTRVSERRSHSRSRSIL